MKRVLVFLCLVIFCVEAVVAQWQMTSYNDGSRVQSLVKHPGVLFAGTEGGGVFSSVSEGLKWSHLSNSILLNDVKWLASYGSVLMVAGSYAAPVYSTNRGASWAVADQGLGGVEIDIVASTCDGILAGILGQLMRFDTTSGSWQVFSSTPLNTKIIALDCSYPYFLAGTNWYGPYISPNWGGYWAKSIVSNDLIPIVTNFAQIGEAYFCGSISSGLFKSSDYGNHWVSLDGVPVDAPISIVASNEILVAATVSGVQYSTDLGNSWTLWNEGLDLPLAYQGEAPALLVTDDFLIMAGHNIWRRSLSELTSEGEQPGQPVRCFPNPTSGLLVFEGCTTNAGIMIHAADGRLVAVGQLENRQFDISFLPRGVYLCRLKDGPRVLTTCVLMH